MRIFVHTLSLPFKKNNSFQDLGTKSVVSLRVAFEILVYTPTLPSLIRNLRLFVSHPYQLPPFVSVLTTRKDDVL